MKRLDLLFGLWSAILAAAMAAPLAAGAAPEVKSAPLRLTPEGHFTTPVRINGGGPKDFVVDTAASVTVLSAGQAADLRLEPVDSRQAQMHAAAGSHAPRLYRIPVMTSALFEARDVVVAAMPASGGGHHAGVLGMREFAQGRLEFDVAGGALRFGPSTAAPAGYVAVSGRRMHNTFLLVDVDIDGVKATAIIDSGARRSLGNAALQAALGLQPGDARLSRDQPLSGATAHRIEAVKAAVGRLGLGPVSFERPTVSFAAAPIFGQFGLGDAPAIIIGADLLARSRSFAVDYPRSELQILMPPPAPGR